MLNYFNRHDKKAALQMHAKSSRIVFSLSQGNALSYTPADFPLIHDATGALCACCPKEMKFSPIKVDFLSGRYAGRLARHHSLDEPLAKAIGLTPHAALTVIDATAGFGREGMLLALLGCSVIMIEQSPIMAALLKDGLLRAKADSAFSALLTQEIECIEGRAQEWIGSLTSSRHIDAIYLDPMFPLRTKTAAVKKEMQFLHAVVGNQSGEDDDLFAAALASGVSRVVVKRPANAKPLGDKAPDYSVSGGQMRFDVYRRE